MNNEPDFSAFDQKKIARSDFSPADLEKINWPIYKNDRQILRLIAFVAIVMLPVLFAEFIMKAIFESATFEDSAYQVFLSVIIGIIFAIALLAYIFKIALPREEKRKLRVAKFVIDNGWEGNFRRSSLRPAPLVIARGIQRIVHFCMTDPRDWTIFGEYPYTIVRDSSGKRTYTTYSFCYAQVKLSRKVPHVILNGRQNSFGVSEYELVVEKVAPEGDFNRFFSALVPPGYRRDALQLLTPDVMEALKNFAQGYDLELVGDKLFIIAKGEITSAEIMRHLYRAAEKLRAEFSRQAKNYSDDKLADRVVNTGRKNAPIKSSSARNLVAKPGRRIQQLFFTEDVVDKALLIFAFVFLFVMLMIFILIEIKVSK